MMSAAGVAPSEPRRPTEKIAFYQDDGYRLDGDVYVRPGANPKAAIIFCDGWGGSRTQTVSAVLATAITDRLHCLCVTFDHSGFGTSEGPRNRLDPDRRVNDARSAITWVQVTRPELSKRIGLFGTSFGAGIATVAASIDKRARALVAISGYSSGEAFLREMRPHWQFVDFKERLDKDRRARVITGKSEVVDPDTILIRDPDSAAYIKRLLEKEPEHRFELDLASADKVMEFDVIGYAPRLYGQPSLFIHAERDLLIPWQQSEAVASAAGGKFVLLHDLGHHELYSGAPLARLLDHVEEFFAGNLINST